MKRVERVWLGLRDASNVHAFHQSDLDRRGDGDGMVWAVERKCGSFTSSALGENEGAELCPFCLRAVRREWLIDCLFAGVLVARSVGWTLRRVGHWVERRLWGRP